MSRVQSLTALCLLGLAVSVSPGAVAYEIGERFTDTPRSGGQGPEMVIVPSGRFTLGGGTPGQQNLGVIDIGYRLAFGITEVTRGQYRQFLEAVNSPQLE